MRALLVLALIAVPSTTTVAAVVQSAPRREHPCEILDYGFYRAVTSRETVPDEGSVTGDRFETEEIEFTQRTKTIPRVRDKSFGIQYKLTSLATDRDAKITWRITFPRSIKGKRGWELVENWSAPTGELVQHIGYTFVHDWEMVPGDWKMQILVEDQPACSFTFKVK